ncbi:PTS system, beta-glucosides-specific IIC component [Lachnospiraceae bacterium]|nr:PTS system, beta-glucosides-specific IIC component [Lachnospiraceae bacterium]
MDYNKIAAEILKDVGGKENVKDLTHCFTRLRFVLKDSSKADKAKVERREGVIQVVEAGGQFQVVLGSKVNKVYDEMIKMVPVGEEGSDISVENGSFINVVLQTISKIFTPIVPAIAAAGLIKGLLSAASRLGWVDAEASTYIILNTASNIIFYFMPIFLAYTATKAIKCNQVIAMVLGGFLCHPVIDALIQDVENPSSIFGLPVIKKAFTIGESTKVFSYTESVIPIILAVIVLHFLEKALKKVVPEILQVILVPGVSLIVMLPITLVVVGPVGIYIGYAIQWLYTALYGFSPLLGGIVVGGLWGVCVIFGAHRALLPIGLNDVAISGTNTLMCFAGSANFSQAGAALGVMLKSRNNNTKQVAGAATISAFLVGITEPAIYGCNLRLKKPMICAVIAGACGGAVMGLGHAVNTGFANNGILTIMSYYGEGTSLGQFAAYLLGIAVAFFGAAALTYIVGFEDDKADTAETPAAVEEQKPVLGGETHTMTSPVLGKFADIKEVNDEVFSSESLGKGFAVNPTEGIVRAPEDCSVSLVFPTKHAVGLLLNNGAEVMIHIGLNTVELQGKHFEQHAKTGDKLKKGDPIVSFDIDAIKKEGYDLITPVIVSNVDQFRDIRIIPGTDVNESTEVIEMIR